MEEGVNNTGEPRYTSVPYVEEGLTEKELDEEEPDIEFGVPLVEDGPEDGLVVDEDIIGEVLIEYGPTVAVAEGDDIVV